MTNWFSGSANTRDILAHRHIEGTSNWFYAIGSTVKFKGGIPGSQEAEKQVELYAQCEPSNGCMCKCVGVSVHVYLCFCCCSFLYLHVNFCLCARVCMYLCLRSHVSIQDITITTHTYRACMMLQWYFGSTTDIVQRECMVNGTHGCVSSLSACTERGRRNKECGFFAYAEKCHSVYGNCVLYDAVSGCPDDHEWTEFNAYRLQRGSISNRKVAEFLLC